LHHTKEKGDLGVLKAQLDLFEQGFMILNPRWCIGLSEGKCAQEQSDEGRKARI